MKSQTTTTQKLVCRLRLRRSCRQIRIRTTSVMRTLRESLGAMRGMTSATRNAIGGLDEHRVLAHGALRTFAAVVRNGVEKGGEPMTRFGPEPIHLHRGILEAIISEAARRNQNTQ